MKRNKTQQTTLAHRQFLRDVIRRSNKALKPVGVELAASLPKRLPTGGGAFVEIPVEVKFGNPAKPTIETVKIFPVVHEIETTEFRSVFAVSVIEEALKVVGAHRDKMRRALLANVETFRENVSSIAGR